MIKPDPIEPPRSGPKKDPMGIPSPGPGEPKEWNPTSVRSVRKAVQVYLHQFEKGSYRYYNALAKILQTLMEEWEYGAPWPMAQELGLNPNTLVSAVAGRRIPGRVRVSRHGWLIPIKAVELSMADGHLTGKRGTYPRGEGGKHKNGTLP